eukprot:CAMPEP_0119323222 /NCGR_PEP_ID=MMETSP1333-20130426/60323_1 /TAXON_ID=418940 /ORGANISM="Scyphosphaera apsteinii, Strain RCC1455" /LENGTH=288 /DNA_ID=CAMNT_0007330617 /DNA_START=103 /DNA_END=966 /DNA_ORIENTATION=-
MLSATPIAAYAVLLPSTRPQSSSQWLEPCPRRVFIGAILTSRIFIGKDMASASQSGYVEGFAPRVEGIGGGADMLSSATTVLDVVYPPSLIGLWQCERQVASVEGDANSAESVWLDLGGRRKEDFLLPETYLTRFLVSPNSRAPEGEAQVVTDRGFEIDSRQRGTNVSWDAGMPNTLLFERAGRRPTELTVVQRQVEPPSDKGFGFNELVRITTAAGGLFGEQTLLKAARVQRKYRRAYTATGERLVEGLEIVKSYRVLDGVAGVEIPTSTTKSRLKLTRPPPGSMFE